MGGHQLPFGTARVTPRAEGTVGKMIHTASIQKMDETLSELSSIAT